MPSDPFSPQQVPGYSDGDWPDWPEQEMLEWLPPSIIRLGLIRATRLNGNFLVLDPLRAQEIIAAMEAFGHECRLNHELVKRICGYV